MYLPWPRVSSGASEIRLRSKASARWCHVQAATKGGHDGILSDFVSSASSRPQAPVCLRSRMPCVRGLFPPASAAGRVEGRQAGRPASARLTGRSVQGADRGRYLSVSVDQIAAWDLRKPRLVRPPNQRRTQQSRRTVRRQLAWSAGSRQRASLRGPYPSSGRGSASLRIHVAATRGSRPRCRR